MSFDFLPDEANATMLRASRSPSLAAEPGFFTGMVPGAASLTMEGFAKTARAIDLLGAIGPMVEDRLTGGTAAQDKYFQEHDDLFNSAVDYWTPKPGEVGTAGRVVGSILPTLAQVAVSPSLAIGTAELGTAEDLVRQGIDAQKAVKAGIIQGTGLGLGIYLPIFGNSLATRALIAGAGSNVIQGVVSRAATRKVLEGTPAEKQFDPWDAESIVIDALMGTAFGTMAHVAEGAKRPTFSDSDKAAILTANQARHLEDTTAPGQPVGDVDRTLHATAMRKAVDDVLSGRPAEVGQIIQDAKFTPDPAREAAQQDVVSAVADEARSVNEYADRLDQIFGKSKRPTGLEAGQVGDLLREIPDLPRPSATGFTEAFGSLKGGGVTDALYQGLYKALEEGKDSYAGVKDPILARARPAFDRGEIKSAADLRTFAETKTEAQAKAEVAPAAEVDPIVSEARQRLVDRPDLTVTDENGKTVKLADHFEAASKAAADARANEGLFATATQCFLGMV